MKMKFSDLYLYISGSVDLWMLVELKNLRFILVYVMIVSEKSNIVFNTKVLCTL